MPGGNGEDAHPARQAKAQDEARRLGSGDDDMTTVNTPHWGDECLEQALRVDAREHATAYLEDEGFTARLLEQLPRPAALPAWRRPVVALLWLIAAVGAAAALPGLFYDVF